MIFRGWEQIIGCGLFIGAVSIFVITAIAFPGPALLLVSGVFGLTMLIDRRLFGRRGGRRMGEPRKTSLD